MTAPSAAMRLAEEIAYELRGDTYDVQIIAAIIAKHAPPADAALREALKQSLSQWRMYAEMEAGVDLEKDVTPEASLYRHCRADLDAALAAGPADAVPVEPTHCFNADDWEVTYEWRDRSDLADELGLKDSLRVGVLVRQPDKWIACVPVTWDEDGSPDETAIRWFDSLEEAEAAINAEPPR